MVTQLLLSGGCILLALTLDHILGEPKKAHPLVLFGRLAGSVESRLNNHTISSGNMQNGLYGWSATVLPIVFGLGLLGYLAGQLSTWLLWMFEAAILYLCIGWRSLKEHMLAIHSPLANQKLEAARYACSMVVSRDTQHLDEAEIAKAAVESTLENGSDGIYAAIFWFALLGIPGVVLYRLSNTLDAMWGYRTERHESFGKWAAKVDDALNWIPARITAWLYIANAFIINKPSGKQLAQSAIANWKSQAPTLSSPNGGPVMITGATILDVKLGGPTSYHGKLIDKPFFGGQGAVGPQHIPKALNLIDRTLVGWVMIAVIVATTLS